MLSNKILKSLLITCTITVVMSMITACMSSGSQGGVQNNTKSKENEGPTKISMMTTNVNVEPIKPDNAGLIKLQEFTNSKLDITWVPTTAYNDKLNVTIASNSMPNVIAVLENKAPSIITATRSGLFWELGPYLKNYKNLSKINPNVLNNISVDGKIYGLPRERSLARNGIIFRKDWLDQLGLKTPKTTDEIYQVLKAFTTKDLDKNGKESYGISESKDFRGFYVMLAYFGGPNGWEQKDGKFTPDFMTKEYMDTMKFFKRLFDEKVINQDFLITSAQTKADNVNNGKAGMYMDYSFTHVQRKFDPLLKVNPKAELDVVTRINGPKGERVFATPGHNGIFVIPKTSVKTEEQLKQILTYFDKLYDNKVSDLFAYGVEGTYYTLENGKKVATEKQMELYNTEIALGLYQLSLLDSSTLPLMEGQIPVKLKAQKMDKDNASIIVNNPAEPLISTMYAEKGSGLDKNIWDARAKFVMGKIDEAGWNSAVDQWRKSGGDMIIDEYSKEYAKLPQK